MTWKQLQPTEFIFMKKSSLIIVIITVVVVGILGYVTYDSYRQVRKMELTSGLR